MTCQTGDQFQRHTLGLQPGDIGVAAAVGGEFSYPLHLSDGGIIPPPERSHTVIGIAAGKAPDVILSSVLPEILCSGPRVFRDRDRAESAFALGRAQNRVVIHRFNGMADPDLRAILGDIRRREGQQFLDPKAGIQHHADAVTGQVVGQVLFKQLDLFVIKGVFLISGLRQGSILVPDDLGLSGRIACYKAVGIGSIKNLNQHGSALPYLREAVIARY